MATPYTFLSLVRRPRWQAGRRFAVPPADRGATLSTDAELASLCDSGLPDAELCDVSRVPPRNAPSAAAEAWTRFKWLAGLLAVQSTSSFVLDAYGDLLRDHLSVTLFLVSADGEKDEERRGKGGLKLDPRLTNHHHPHTRPCSSAPAATRATSPPSL